MEETKQIPCWFQRLSSHQTKPASQISFKQYCHNNEAKMKVLYPFLTQEQVRGKLHTRWKRFLAGNHSRPFWMHRGTKKLNPNKFPVVNFTKDARHQEKLDCQFDWLKETKDSKALSQTLKTYKDRAFVLRHPVPTIISELFNPERSILKHAGTSTPRAKQEVNSSVSFTLNDPEFQSPQVNSPPTPFVLSPLNDKDLAEESRAASKKFAEKYPNQKLSEQVQSKVSSRSEYSNESSKQKPSGTTARKSKKSNQRTRIEDTPLSSQYLEPPKFFQVPSETVEEKENRCCLFEDECVLPKSTEKKKKPRNKRKPSVGKYNPKQSFAWSPALGCSQYTPKLNKTMTGLFPSEEGLYQRQKHPYASTKSCDLTKATYASTKSWNPTKESYSSTKLCDLTKEHWGINCRKQELNSERRQTISSASPKYAPQKSGKANCSSNEQFEKRGGETKKSQKSELPSKHFSVSEEHENETRNTKLPETKTPKFSHIIEHGGHENEKKVTALNKQKTATPLVQNDCFLEIRDSSPKHNHDSPIERTKTNSIWDSPFSGRKGNTASNTKCKHFLQRKLGHEEEKDQINVMLSLPFSRRKANTADNDTGKRLLKRKQPCVEEAEDNVLPLSFSGFTTATGKNSLMPDTEISKEEDKESLQTQQETDLLKRILLQLKGTKTSQKDEVEMSPAPSWMTEAIKNNEYSEEDILYNMFSAPSYTSVSIKPRRNLPSHPRPAEGNIDMQLDDDILERWITTK